MQILANKELLGISKLKIEAINALPTSLNEESKNEETGQTLSEYNSSQEVLANRSHRINKSLPITTLLKRTFDES
jgi:hypothetical protein